MTTRFEKLTFPGSQGASLAGRLELPEGEPRAFAAVSATKRSYVRQYLGGNGCPGARSVSAAGMWVCSAK